MIFCESSIINFNALTRTVWKQFSTIRKINLAFKTKINNLRDDLKENVNY